MLYFFLLPRNLSALLFAIIVSVISASNSTMSPKQDSELHSAGEDVVQEDEESDEYDEEASVNWDK